MNNMQGKIYSMSPGFMQNAAVNLYGLKIVFREYGSKFRLLMREFEKTQRYSESDIREYQNERLRMLIRHSYDNVPYYRSSMDQRRLTPSDFVTVDDLPKLPILTRQAVRENFDRLISTTTKSSSLIVGNTSGTTGSPLKFCWDKQICLAKNVVDWRQKSWAGIKPGDRMAFFQGRVIVPVNRKTPPYWRTNWFLNHMFFSGFHISENSLGSYVRQLEKFAPRAIEGYPSTIYILARYLLSRGSLLPIRAVFTSSEALFPFQREAIEKAFGCKVFDFYGMAERIIFAGECEFHSGHHVNMDFGITEILKDDGSAAATGELGRIVATGLHNFAMPLIRYRTTDISAFKNTKCSCGRNFPLIENVTSRAEDRIITQDGRYISPLVFQDPFAYQYNISESQIIQEDLDRLVIKIVKGPAYGPEDTRDLLDRMNLCVGPAMKIEIEFVDFIPRTKAGKFTWITSKVSKAM
jgi:phenylacetate-CoA ligase